jgi:hypothetical protein
MPKKKKKKKDDEEEEEEEEEKKKNLRSKTSGHRKYVSKYTPQYFDMH